MNEAYNIDCMEYMRNVPDGYFDIAVCDPPYGIKINESIGRRKGDAHSGRKKAYWDAAPPPPSILTSCVGYQKIKLYGAQTILSVVCRGIVDAGCYGIKSLATNFHFHSLKWHIPLLVSALRNSTKTLLRGKGNGILRKSPWSYTNGFTGFLPKTVIRY